MNGKEKTYSQSVARWLLASLSCSLSTWLLDLNTLLDVLPNLRLWLTVATSLLHRLSLICSSNRFDQSLFDRARALALIACSRPLIAAIIVLVHLASVG